MLLICPLFGHYPIPSHPLKHYGVPAIHHRHHHPLSLIHKVTLNECVLLGAVRGCNSSSILRNYRKLNCRWTLLWLGQHSIRLVEESNHNLYQHPNRYTPQNSFQFAICMGNSVQENGSFISRFGYSSLPLQCTNLTLRIVGQYFIKLPSRWGLQVKYYDRDDKRKEVTIMFNSIMLL